jgi:hypothetical protein
MTKASNNFQTPIKAYLILLFIVSLVIFSIKPVLAAHTAAEQMNRIKTAFIFNIAHYITWTNLPNTSDNTTIKLCFFRKNPFASSINNIQNKSFGNKKMLVQYIPLLDNKFDCQMLFLTQEQITRIALQMKNSSLIENKNSYSLLFNKNVLIMGDLSNGHINAIKLNPIIIYLIRQGDHIGIEINMQSLSRSRIKLSSQLLKLSKIN